MRSHFHLPGQDDWSFRLVLLGGQAQLEGTRGDLHCNAWLTPLQSPVEAAHQLMRQPSCCLIPAGPGMIAA
jgi:hypothetical protein